MVGRPPLDCVIIPASWSCNGIGADHPGTGPQKVKLVNEVLLIFVTTSSVLSDVNSLRIRHPAESRSKLVVVRGL